MNFENIVLHSTKFILSESEEESDVLIGKFIICDFLPNKNGVQIDRETILEWLTSLKDKPLVGKISVSDVDGSKDFTSHNVKIVEKKDDYGNCYKNYEFDTSAFGTFFDVVIESINGIEYIVAYCKIWKRFSDACEVIKSRALEGGLFTSWEISIIKQRISNYMGNMIRIIEKGCFLGHCLLSKLVEPAYDSSHLLNVASEGKDLEAALFNDIYNFAKKEDETLPDIEKNKNLNEKIVIETSDVEETVKTTDVEIKAETSALTDWDLRRKIAKACEAKLGNCWCWISFHFPLEKIVWVEKDCRESELDYLIFTYEVNGEDIVVSEPVAAKLMVNVSQINSTIESLKSDLSERDDTILKLNTKLQELSNEIATLVPFKNQFEKIEQERIANETAARKDALKEKIVQSKVMTIDEIETSEEIKNMIDKLDENGINKIVVDKLINTISKDVKLSKKTETAQKEITKVQTNINDTNIENSEKEKITHREFMNSYIWGK